MSMVGIDLTPPQEIKRQKTQYAVGTSVKLAALLLLVALGTGGYFFYKSSVLNRQLSDLSKQETDLISQKDALRTVENYAKKLSGKYFLLQKYLENRSLYSSMLLELVSRVPVGITLDTVNFDGMEKRASVTGSAADVIQVSDFVNQLSKEGNASSESSPSLSGKKAFTDVRLDSLRVDERTGEKSTVKYNVSFKVNGDLF